MTGGVVPGTCRRHDRSPMTDGEEFPERPTGELISLGFRSRCPRCGVGRIFSGYLKIADACPVCGLGLTGHDVGDGPVVPAMLLIGSIVVGLALAVELIWEPAVWVRAVLWAPLVLARVMTVLPRIKGIAVALQHAYRSTEEDGRPGGT